MLLEVKVMLRSFARQHFESSVKSLGGLKVKLKQNLTGSGKQKQIKFG